MRKRDVKHDTPFGAFANKFISENSEGRVKSHGSSLLPSEIKDMKLLWRDLIEHCIEQLDVRFPPDNLAMFELLQVVDPSLTLGPFPRHLIGEKSLDDCVLELLHIFELPLHFVDKIQAEEVLNSFITFRGSEFAKQLYSTMYKRHRGKAAHDPSMIYKFYYACLEKPALMPWAFFSLYMLVFPTGNAISERGFSAMGAAKSKGRSELSVKQVMAYMVIGFNGPSLKDFADMVDTESKTFQKQWWGYQSPTNF